MKICLTCEGVTADAADRCAHCGCVLLETTAVHFPERRGDEDARNPLVGRVIDGKYRIIGVLGRGGMGAVYRAVHEVSLVHVALKVLHPRLSAHAEFRSWFLAEARKAGRVVHENSARVTDVGVARDGMIYIAVEFVDGVTLQEWLAPRSVGPHRALALLEQIARALSAAHAAGVVHRDLSPRNVMVTIRDGRECVKILDFGIALAPPRPTAEGDDDHGAPAGFANPPYSAPEHLEGEVVDGRADLYSLGVIAFEALSGELPVGGTTVRELAAETRRGRIRPLRARAGVPKGVQRLVHQLLALDPTDRPASAGDVADRLARLRQPRRRGLAIASVAALVASTAAFAITHTAVAAPEAYLRARGGLRPLVVGPAPGEVQELRSLDVLKTAFDHAGFDPAALRLEVGNGERARSLRLGDVLRPSSGVLRLRPSAASLIEQLAAMSRDGPLELRFVVPGRAPLGYARLRIDDDPPQIEFAVLRDDPDRRSLRAEDRLEVRVRDAGPLVSSRLEVRLLREPGGHREASSVPLGEGPVAARAAELLAKALHGHRSWGPAELQVVANDRAGNVGRSAVVSVTELDLAVPQILEVTAPNGRRSIVQDTGGAELRLRLSDAEPGLAVFVQRPGSAEFDELTDVRVVAEQIVDLRLPPPSSGIEPSGVWRFTVRDPIGNRSAVIEERLEFLGAEAELELRPAAIAGDGPSRIARLGRQFVTAGAAQFELSCNPIYLPIGVSIDAQVGGSATHKPILCEPELGRGLLELPELPPGSYSLSIELEEPSSGRSVRPTPIELLVLPARITLRLPDPGTGRYLSELEDRGLLRRDGAALHQGAAWSLEPADARLVRGRLWGGSADHLQALQGIDPQQPMSPLLVDAPLTRGWQVIAVELEDLLGRPVDVRLGDAPAPEQILQDGRVVARIARFHHHPEPFSTIEPVALLEHGQALRLELRSMLPIEDADRTRLRVAGGGLLPSRVLPEDGSARLTFTLPFERVVIAAPALAGADEAAFAAGIDAQMPLRVSSPGGEFEVLVRIRTLRTTLRAVEIAQLDDSLPPTIAAMRFVPIPAPGATHVWPDPVRAERPGRDAIRAAPALTVRNVGDCYLLDRELTRAQYFAIVSTGLRRIEGVDRRDFVHADDPLGMQRLTSSGLWPIAFPSAGIDWYAASATAPDRPISGINAFQAHTVASLLGWVVLRDPQAFRLPLGVELEVAALALPPPDARGDGSAEQGPLNAAAAHGGRLDFARLRLLARRSGAPDRWPPTADQLATCGDVVTTELGDRVFGLDTGLREWVLDLPFLPGVSESRVLLSEWLSDHLRHEQCAVNWARDGAPDRTPADLRAFVATLAVLRGVGLDDVGSLADTRGDPALWPGVVRVVQMRRDGEGLVPGRPDRHVAGAGMRIAGGARFVREVRTRW